MSSFLNQTFDDRDTTHLKYEGDWVLGGSYNASNVGETGTLSSTKDLNARVTFVRRAPFRFDWVLILLLRHFRVRQLHRRKLRYHNLLLCAHLSPSNCLLLLWHSTMLRRLVWDMYRLRSPESELPPHRRCQSNR